MKTLSLIIPAYNEESAIGPFLDSLERIKYNCEIVVVDDGSTDKTEEEIKRRKVILIRHKRNKGYGSALKSGIRMASGEIVVIADSDGQHTAEDINTVIDKMMAVDDDLVIGERMKGSHKPITRKPGKFLLKIVLDFLAGRDVRDYNSGLRAFKREVILKYLHLMPNSFSFSTTSIFAFIKSGYDISFIPIIARKRIGKSTVKPIKHGISTIFLILKLVILFHPIKVFSVISIPMFLIAIIDAAFNFLVKDKGLADLDVMFFTSSILIFLFGLITDQISSMRREKYE